MKRSGPPERKTPLRRETRIPPRSQKRKAVYDAPLGRRDFVAGMLATHPTCERCGQRNPVMDVHELLSRARAGGKVENLLDEEGCRVVCRPCHSMITENPRWARQHGWALPSWAGDCERARAAYVRAMYRCAAGCSVDHTEVA